MSEFEGLPAHLAAAWGLRERPTKGPKPSLTLERIVEAGVTVAQSEGLAAVSMSRVAAALGASTMSLYRYVTSKDELLALMMDTAMGAPPAARPDEGWREGLVAWARAERAAMLRHPWVLRVPISGPPLTPNQIAWLEWGFGYLRDTGLTAHQKLSVILLLSNFVWRTTTIESDIVEAAEAAGSTAAKAMAGYGRMLAKLADPGRFAEVHKAIAEGAFDDDGDDGLDQEFTFGLERILDGVETLVRGRQERRPARSRRSTGPVSS